MAPAPRRRVNYSKEEREALLEPIYLLTTVESARDASTGAAAGHAASSSSGGGGGAGGSGSTTISSYDPVSPVLRAISNSKQRDAFVSSLTGYIDRKDSEIARVCRDNYGDYLNSTEKLLKVRKGTVNLRSTLSALDGEIQAKGSVLAGAKRELLESERVASNIDDSVQTLQACLRVLDLSSKIHRLISVDRNYYAALRSLDDLLAIHLKPLLQFGFAQHMLATLPLTKLQIRAEVTTEFKSWLFDARQAGKELGRKAIEQYEKRARRWRERGVGSSAPASAAGIYAALSATPLNGPVEIGVSEKYEYNASLLDDTSRIDFKPLYQCIHIYDTLDALEELQKSYQADRSAQASLILSESQSIVPFSLDVLSQLLEEIVGFFIIEAYVLTSTASGMVRRKAKFRTAEQVGELWSTMSERLAHVVTSGLRETNDPDTWLATKGKLLSTVQTLQGFDYSTELLNKIMADFLRRYSSIISSKFAADFKQIVQEDDNQPMRVENADELEKVMDVSYLPFEGPWSASGIRSKPFPIELPFSPTYPLCCIDIRNMIAQFRQFSEGAVTLQAGDELLREALERLLNEAVVDSIVEKIRTTGNLPGLAQTIANLEYFQIAANQISDKLASRTPVGVESNISTALRQAVVRIISVISRQLDGFFEDARYDWLSRRQPQASPGASEEDPSPFMLDMVNYLSLSMDNQLASLSPAHRTQVFRGTLQHCATALMALLLDKNPAKISPGGLAYFAVDVRFMAALAANLPGQGLDEVFHELTQIATLLEGPSPIDYLDKDLRQMAYSAITIKKLQPVIQKLLSYYSSVDQQLLSQAERKKKAELESVMRVIQRASVQQSQAQ